MDFILAKIIISSMSRIINGSVLTILWIFTRAVAMDVYTVTLEVNVMSFRNYENIQKNTFTNLFYCIIIKPRRI